MDARLAERAREPRYSFAGASRLVGRRSDTVRRWSAGNQRTYNGQKVTDDPLLQLDGDRAGTPLSFLNLLELQMLSRYRDDAPLQAIRPALEFAAQELGEPRPLLTVRFRVLGGELFARFAATPDGQELLLNATRRGQTTALPELVEETTKDIDYEADTASRWWFGSRQRPMFVDTRIAAGRPITSETGVRVDAILSRHDEGLQPGEIAEDTGATAHEVDAVIALPIAA
jgi:uncharacterized protein (DUF433 family)